MFFGKYFTYLLMHYLYSTSLFCHLDVAYLAWAAWKLIILMRIASCRTDRTPSETIHKSLPCAFSYNVPSRSCFCM